MRIFSKLVLICNLCFVAAVIMRLVEMARRAKGNLDAAIPIQSLEATLVLLGYGAIFLNILFLFAVLIQLLRGNKQSLPRLLVLVNLVILPVQVWYFFFSNF